jgi:hypothetical protein
MIGKVESYTAEIARDLGLIEKVAVLAPIGAGGMANEKRDPFARFLKVDAVLDPLDGEVDIASLNRFDLCHCTSSILMVDAKKLHHTV